MTDDEKRLLIKIFGIVQGVGFRPFVATVARDRGIRGTVCNRGSYVEIRALGDERAMELFLGDLREKAPDRSVILKLKTREMDEAEIPQDACGPVDPGDQDNGFHIIESRKGQGLVFVSPDIATCPQCEKELFDPKDRRYLHPFINCTACGPRLTILDSMPYDRERTSMGEFPMCPDCSYEYTHQSTRRYHAQPVCCNECGPELYILGKNGEQLCKGNREPLVRARQVIRQGGILAVKGIGGFHLCCDARNEETVQRLRKLKHRDAKPFAVMMRDLDTVARECLFTPEEETLLTGPQKPILLLEKKKGGLVAPSAAPGNPNIGVMLPYAPVQMLLFKYPDGEDMTDVLIMTSGNPSGAPITMDDREAVKFLAPLCDQILSNNRKIRIRADDTVMSFYSKKPYMIRRSRGYAPLPVIMPSEIHHSVLAVGGELKNTFCLAKEDMYYMSPYIGDMADIRSIRALEAAVERMKRLLEIEPEAVVCDLHPGYHTGEVGEKLARETGEGLQLLKVQHHYAHVASCMAENEYTDNVIGVSFDGTGYGTDGTIWGGEFMIADFDGFRRIGSITPFIHAGGDVASREGWRIAASMGPDLAEDLDLGDGPGRRAIAMMKKNNINAIKSTSCGRLFDAVSAVLGICQRSTFEGQASMALQFQGEKARSSAQAALLAEECRKYLEETGGLLRITETDEPEGPQEFFQLRTDALFRWIGEKVLAEASQSGGLAEEMKGSLGFVFHRLLAEMTIDGCLRARESTGLNTIALSGGVMQNLLLVEMLDSGLKSEGFRVLLHSQVPPNDGGIALGQAAIAMYRLEEQDRISDK